MKVKKRLVIATCTASIISILLAVPVLFQFFITRIGKCGEISSFMVNLSFAIFGSAALGFIMSIVEYFVAKKHALENYYLEALKTYNIFSKIVFLQITEPKDLLIEHFSSEAMNDVLAKPNKSANGSLYEYMKTIWMNTVDIPEPYFSDYSITSFNGYIEDFVEKMIVSMDSYLDIASKKITFLDTAYADFDFLFCNNRLRNKIYKEIHRPFFEHKRMINEKAIHFRSYKNANNGNTAVMIDFIDELQQNFFTVDKKTDEYVEIYIVHRHFLDEMDNRLEMLRCLINHEQYTPLSHYPYLQYQKRIKAQNGINTYYSKNREKPKTTE